MDKVLKPEKLSIEHRSPGAEETYEYWKTSVSIFIDYLQSLTKDPIDKYKVVFGCLSPAVYARVNEHTTFTTTIEALDKLYLQTKNELYARHQLNCRKQEHGETLDKFYEALLDLSKNCKFQSVNANLNRNEHIRDSLISGLRSPNIRQRLLENKTLTLEEAYSKAKTLEDAEKLNESYATGTGLVAGVTNEKTVTPQPKTGDNENQELEAERNLNLVHRGSKCFFCNNARHPRSKCPAKESICGNCKKTGHWARACRSKSSDPSKESKDQKSVSASSVLATITTFPRKLSKSLLKTYINNHETETLIDSGSSDSFIDKNYAEKLGLTIYPQDEYVTLASKSLNAPTIGYVVENLKYNEQQFPKTKFTVMKGLCADLLLGLDHLSKHTEVILKFGGVKPPLSVCNLASLNVQPPPLFQNLDPLTKPIADRSRSYSKENQTIINQEIQRLLKEKIIEPSRSPWRAQVLIVTQNSGKKRMVIDYSRTINRFTLLDAYPLPKINELVNKVSQYKYYSSLDLRSAYHQVKIRDDEKIYTAFEANGQLYQFCRIPFGVTNGVACFQRVVDEIIHKENLQATYAYIDNLTVCGNTKEEHDANLERFYQVAASYNFTFNHDKSEIFVTSLKLLGYLICKNELRPDPDRLQSLLDLPIPDSPSKLKRVLGFFSYYSQWIPKYAEKSHPLNVLLKRTPNSTFTLNANAIRAFTSMKEDIVSAAKSAIDEDLPFVVETDASHHSLAATLNQGGRPVAFFSRTLTASERNYPAVEKEACAIVEALKKWRHFLLGKKFTLLTDQRSISFMLNPRAHGKVKNEKISRWRIELSCFAFDILYRRGAENKGADLLSRSFNCAVPGDQCKLTKLHSDLCHPGIARLNHFVRSRNLPYSVEEIKRVVGSCPVCAKLKPTFFKPESPPLIKATQPFERLSMDFKGPVPSSTKHRYLLTIVDEYSRFPFAFACTDLSAATVIRCLDSLFAMFGMPSYIHSDRGTSFMSSELKNYLTGRGIATSRSTPYNPEGNGQVERYNGTIWKTIELAAASRGIEVRHWQDVLPEALHSIRSLLCTSTNTTPHERMFKYSRRSTNGTSVPSWLVNSQRVLLRRFVRDSKYEPSVSEVELLETKPTYAHVRHADGRESTVSLKHLAPLPSEGGDLPDVTETVDDVSDSVPKPVLSPPEQSPQNETVPSPSPKSDASPELRRSTRTRRPPNFLRYTKF